MRAGALADTFELDDKPKEKVKGGDGGETGPRDGAYGLECIVAV